MSREILHLKQLPFCAFFQGHLNLAHIRRFLLHTSSPRVSQSQSHSVELAISGQSFNSSITRTPVVHSQWTFEGLFLPSHAPFHHAGAGFCCALRRTQRLIVGTGSGRPRRSVVWEESKKHKGKREVCVLHVENAVFALSAVLSL